MAMQTPAAYHSMQDVFLMYEEGSLKNQKPRSLTEIGRKKALQGKYSAKMHHFKIFQGLEVTYSVGN